MKNLFCLIFSILGFGFIAQSQNNIFPINGKVGIQTTTPSEALDVNGNLIVASL